MRAGLSNKPLEWWCEMTTFLQPRMLFFALMCSLPIWIPSAFAAEAPKVDFGAPVHSITVPHDEPYLPDGPGRSEFLAQCVICHSPRYVTNQPAFPRKTWAAEVAKMRDEYGAPIPDEAVQPIIDYLMFFNGKETP